MKLSGISDAGMKRVAQFTSPDEGAFQLHELSEQAQERALEQYIEHLDYYGWWDFVYSDAKEDAPAYFEIEDINFSGFASQGDGASWGGYVDLLKWCAAHGDETCASLIKSGYTGAHGAISLPRDNYSHSGGMDLEVGYQTDYPIDDGELDSNEAPPGADEAIQIMEEAVLVEAKEYADQIYRNLEETYEFESSLEAFEDSVAANEWLFDADGNITG